jgi:microcystin-dependent protein
MALTPISSELPTQAVIMWSGSISDIPDGFTLCDGTDPRSGSSSVPDLRNRFISGAGDEYNVGATGGEKEHQLTVGEMPSHTHTANSDGSKTTSAVPGSELTLADSGTNTTSVTGNDEPHENRPRFFALAFIFKL